MQTALGNGSAFLSGSEADEFAVGIGKLAHGRLERFAYLLVAPVQIVRKGTDALREHTLTPAHVDDRRGTLVRPQRLREDEVRNDAEECDQPQRHDIA